MSASSKDAEKSTPESSVNAGAAGHDALDAAAELGGHTGAKQPFRWGMFFGALATVILFAAVIGVGVMFAMGIRPLQARAEQVVYTTPPRVVIHWPAIAKAKEPAQVAQPKASETKDGAGKKSTTGELKDSGKDLPKTNAPAAPKTPGAGAGRVVLTDSKAGADGAAVEPVRTWLPEQFQEELLGAANEAAATAVRGFRPDPLAAVGRVMENSGWFRTRPRVQLLADNTITVEGEWRVPLAVVRREGRDRLVSWDGFPMPPEYVLGKSGLPVIQGVSMGPSIWGPAIRDLSAATAATSTTGASSGIDFSQAWPGAEVPAAVELLALLRGQVWFAQVSGIDTAEFAKSRQLWILTTHNTRVLWGGPASRPEMGETSTTTKLARLTEINRRFRRIDAGRRSIDISGTHPVEINISATGAGGGIEAAKPGTEGAAPASGTPAPGSSGTPGSRRPGAGR
jgi:hypothetical protein